MGTTLNPAVRRVSLITWGGWVGLFGLAVTVGVLTLAVPARAGFAVASLLAPHQALTFLAVASVAFAVARELGFAVPVPYRNVQVPETWRRVLPGWLLATAFGFQLGLGFSTRFTTSLHTLMIVAVVTSASFEVALAASGAYGIARCVAIGSAAGAPRGPGDPTDWIHTRFTPRPGLLWVLRGSCAACTAIASWMLLIK